MLELDPLNWDVSNDYFILAGDLEVPSGVGNAGGSTFFYFCEGIEWFFIIDINNFVVGVMA